MNRAVRQLERLADLVDPFRLAVDQVPELAFRHIGHQRAGMRVPSRLEATSQFCDAEHDFVARAFHPKYQQLDTIHSVPSWVEANDEFHGVVIEASGNRRWKRMIRDLHQGFTRSVMLSALTMDGRPMRENVSQHDAILSAISRHDAVEARKEMTHHILRSGELVVWWLESQGGLG